MDGLGRRFIVVAPDGLVLPCLAAERAERGGRIARSRASERSLALSKLRPRGAYGRAWQGRTSPSGATTMKRRPQPSMHDFGNSA